MRDSTWRYPNFGFWAVHMASLVALGYFAYKAAENNCGFDRSDNISFPEVMPQNKEPEL